MCRVWLPAEDFERQHQVERAVAVSERKAIGLVPGRDKADLDRRHRDPGAEHQSVARAQREIGDDVDGAIVHRIEAERIGAKPAGQHVIAIAADQHVVAARRDDQIVAGAAIEAVVAAAAGQPVTLLPSR